MLLRRVWLAWPESLSTRLHTNHALRMQTTVTQRPQLSLWYPSVPHCTPLHPSVPLYTPLYPTVPLCTPLLQPAHTASLISRHNHHARFGSMLLAVYYSGVARAWEKKPLPLGPRGGVLGGVGTGRTVVATSGTDRDPSVVVRPIV